MILSDAIASHNILIAKMSSILIEVLNYDLHKEFNFLIKYQMGIPPKIVIHLTGILSNNLLIFFKCI